MHTSPPLKKLCLNPGESTSASTGNRRSGDEALDLRVAASAKAGQKPFIAQLWRSKPMKRISFPIRPTAHDPKRPRSKAEEPDCLVRRIPPSITMTTQSSKGRGASLGKYEAPRPQGGAYRARSSKRDASNRNVVHIVPLDPAYPALAGRGTLRSNLFGQPLGPTPYISFTFVRSTDPSSFLGRDSTNWT